MQMVFRYGQISLLFYLLLSSLAGAEQTVAAAGAEQTVGRQAGAVIPSRRNKTEVSRTHRESKRSHYDAIGH